MRSFASALARDIDHARLLIDGPDFPESTVHGEADQARTTSEVQQAALASCPGSLREIIEQALRIRHPEAVVIAGGSPVEIGPELGVIHHAIVAD